MVSYLSFDLTVVVQGHGRAGTEKMLPLLKKKKIPKVSSVLISFSFRNMTYCKKLGAPVFYFLSTFSGLEVVSIGP